MKRYAKLSLVFFLIVSFIFSPLLSSRASAQWIVYDPANFTVNTITASVALGQSIKEGSGFSGGFGLDAIAWFIVNIIIDKLAASTVDWINRGFKGGPTFVTDPEAYFKNIADGVAGEVILNHPDFRYMCSPFKLKVQVALARTYTKPPYQFQCTLTGIANNWDNFMNNFSAGGWDSFLELTQNDQNNPIGLYIQTQSELNNKINSRTEQKKAELNQGRGFLSMTRCPDNLKVTDSASDAQYRDAGYRAGDCLGDEERTTPGAVIQDHLNEVLASGNNRLEVADEINEIITALLNQLAKKALSGLSSLTRSSSGNDKNNFLDRLYSAATNDLTNNGIATIPLKTLPMSSASMLSINEACERGFCTCDTTI
jgi:hypothetical protein